MTTCGGKEKNSTIFVIFVEGQKMAHFGIHYDEWYITSVYNNEPRRCQIGLKISGEVHHAKKQILCFVVNFFHELLKIYNKKCVFNL